MFLFSAGMAAAYGVDAFLEHKYIETLLYALFCILFLIANYSLPDGNKDDR